MEMIVFLSKILSNHAVVAPFIAWITAQLYKIITESIKNGKFQSDRLFGTGGMPSSHTSYISCLATSVGLMAGFESSLFAVAFAFSFVVMYDAVGIRRAAGRQARVLNKLVHTHKNGKVKHKLKEKLGHSPLEVTVGALWGIIVAVLYFYAIPLL